MREKHSQLAAQADVAQWGWVRRVPSISPARDGNCPRVSVEEGLGLCGLLGVGGTGAGSERLCWMQAQAQVDISQGPCITLSPHS